MSQERGASEQVQQAELVERAHAEGIDEDHAQQGQDDAGKGGARIGQTKGAAPEVVEPVAHEGVAHHAAADLGGNPGHGKEQGKQGQTRGAAQQDGSDAPGERPDGHEASQGVAGAEPGGQGHGDLPHKSGQPHAHVELCARPAVEGAEGLHKGVHAVEHRALQHTKIAAHGKQADFPTVKHAGLLHGERRRQFLKVALRC